MIVTREELVPGGQAIWHSETAKTYQCPYCSRPIHSQYEGDDLPLITCTLTLEGKADHLLQWEES